MATSAKKKAALRAKAATVDNAPITDIRKQCTCLVAIRGRGQHAIDCAFDD